MSATSCRFCLQRPADPILRVYPSIPACVPCFDYVAVLSTHERRGYLVSLALQYARDRHDAA